MLWWINLYIKFYVFFCLFFWSRFLEEEWLGERVWVYLLFFVCVVKLFFRKRVLDIYIFMSRVGNVSGGGLVISLGFYFFFYLLGLFFGDWFYLILYFLKFMLISDWK